MNCFYSPWLIGGNRNPAPGLGNRNPPLDAAEVDTLFAAEAVGRTTGWFTGGGPDGGGAWARTERFIDGFFFSGWTADGVGPARTAAAFGTGAGLVGLGGAFLTGPPTLERLVLPPEEMWLLLFMVFELGTTVTTRRAACNVFASAWSRIDGPKSRIQIITHLVFYCKCRKQFITSCAGQSRSNWDVQRFPRNFCHGIVACAGQHFNEPETTASPSTFFYSYLQAAWQNWINTKLRKL